MTVFRLFFKTLQPVPHPMQTCAKVCAKQSLKDREVSDLGKKPHQNKVRVHLLASGQQTSSETGLNLPSTLWLVNLFLAKPISELTDALLWGQLGCRGKVSKQTFCYPSPKVRERTLEVNVYVPWNEDVVCFLWSMVEMSSCSLCRRTKNSFTEFISVKLWLQIQFRVKYCWIGTYTHRPL